MQQSFRDLETFFNIKNMRNNMSTIFLQQTISGRLLLVVIVGAKK